MIRLRVTTNLTAINRLKSRLRHVESLAKRVRTVEDWKRLERQIRQLGR
jgi:hypothetical protein